MSPLKTKGVDCMARKKESTKNIANTKRIPKHKMTIQDKKDWDELYEYVKKNVMGYDDNQKLTNFMILRLKGLPYGLCVANNNSEDMANYSFSLVLTTFKYCSINIKRALETKHFKDDSAKFNYIIAIVENKLNDVYKKMKQAERVQKKQEVVVEKVLSEPEYVHIFKAPEQKKLSAEMESYI